MELEPVPAGASFGQINPVCLFLPAIIYFRWFLVLLMLFEVLLKFWKFFNEIIQIWCYIIIFKVILHVWAHHKNKTLKNANVYFRSPFHDISAEFCALCQNETCMNRVRKMHQIRMHKFLRQCNYMKRVVTWFNQEASVSGNISVVEFKNDDDDYNYFKLFKSST